MVMCLSTLVVLLSSVQAPPPPPGVRVPGGQRTDGLMLVAEEVFQASVSDVVDGDSVVVQDAGRKIRIRLLGVDAPELSQRFGGQAHTFLRTLVMGKTLTVRRRGRSSAGAGAIGHLEVDGADVGAALVSRGLAWHCGRHAENRDLAAAEKVAKDEKRGLWQDDTPTPPWIYRGAGACWEDTKGI